MCSVILTCSVSNVCWTEDVSVIVRWKYVLFCSMFGKDSPWTVHGLLVDQVLVDQQPVDQLLVDQLLASFDQNQRLAALLEPAARQF